MWNKIKKLLGWGKKQERKADFKEVIEGGIMYVYPKTEFIPRVEQEARREEQKRDLRQEAKEWMRSVREVDALYARLAG